MLGATPKRRCCLLGGAGRNKAYIKGANNMDTCPICGESVPDGTAQCPTCDAPLEDGEPKQNVAAYDDRIGGFERFCLKAGIVMSIVGYFVFMVTGMHWLHPILWTLAIFVGFFLMVANVLVYRAALSFYAKQAAAEEKHE